MELIVDMQGFIKDGGVICKELAVGSLQNVLLDHFVFETPPRIRQHSKQNAWLSQCFHKLRWTDGDIPYDQIYKIFQRISAGSYVILVKGLEKKRWLEELLPNGPLVEDLVDFPSLNSTRYFKKPRCAYNHPHCALQNVLKLRDYAITNYGDYPFVRNESEEDEGFVTA